tara:strand:- start:135 stop:335 length:201 start_codon:yes stop_codon:yes gene_type:complete
MVNELHKLNKSQRKSLRALFGGRRAVAVVVDETIDFVTIDFGPVTHWVLLGPRGRVADHNYGPSYS